MKILVIGNKGSFLQDVSDKLAKDGKNIVVIYVPGFYERMELDLHGIDIVLYMSGETRFVDKMEWLNYELPKLIFDQVKNKNIGFIYLSSLSVFGEISGDIVTVDSERKPVDAYGVSKNKFDEYVQKTSLQEIVMVGTIFPASIHAGKGRSSVEKFDKLMSRFPFLRFISLPGSLSCIKRDILTDIIVDMVKNKRYQNLIASDNYRLSNYANKYSLKLPKIFISFFKFTNILIGKRKSLVLRMLLRGIDYK